MSSNHTRNQQKADKTSLFVVVLFAVMLAGIMGFSAVGGGAFDAIWKNRSGNMKRRAVLSYVTAKILECDGKGAIAIEDQDNGSVLIISDPDESNEIESRLYLKDGYLVEEVSSKTSGIVSEPRRIAETQEFYVEADDHTVSVRTEDGTRRIYLHSKEAIR